MSKVQTPIKEEKTDFTQIYIILVQALIVIQDEVRKICPECFSKVKWELQPKYYFNRLADPLTGLPEWTCQNPQVRFYVGKRIIMVYDTLYFLESAFLKLKVS